MSGTITPQKSEFLHDRDSTIAPPNRLGEFIQETLAMSRRLFIQLKRRPSTLLAGVIQPLMWLVLFGALFQNAPQGLFGDRVNYGQFLGA
ncbi:MAG TPA: ABC transporter permease, partial [Leptolyngbya sp.]|nr:ABC transporter permease [Leptolyngbya sp.]